MNELWVKLKPWAVGIACGWVLLAFIFTMQRYGALILSHEFYSVMWVKLGNVILLRWLTDTIFAGLLALVAAAIGALALYNTSRAANASQQSSYEDKRIIDQCSIIRRCQAHCSIMRDTIERYQKPRSEDASLFMHSSDSLSIIDADLTWLGIGLARYTQMISRDDDLSKKTYAIICLKLTYFISLLSTVSNEIERKKFTSTRATNYMPANLLTKLPENGLTVQDMGEFNSLFDWDNRLEFFLRQQAEFGLPSTPPAASAAHQPKS